jgi:UDP-glucuronate decarboxylase
VPPREHRPRRRLSAPSVLVTGGAGFIGYHLARALVDGGDQVHLVDNLSRGTVDRELTRILEEPNARFSELDLLTAPPDAFRTDYTLIFHLSAIVGVSNVVRDPERVLRDNLLMLLKVMEVARRQPHLERLVFASTSEVYAGTLEHFSLPFPTPETTPLALPDLGAPRSAYMLSKLYGEALVRQSGLPFTIVRPHNVYGPRMGMAHVIPELLRAAYELPDGGQLEVASVGHRRTFCYVTDAVEMLERVAGEPRCAGEVLNVGSQVPEVTIGEVADLVIETVGKKLSVRATAPTPGSPTRRCPDMSRLRSLVGYEAQVGLRDGIQQTYAWYRDRLFAKPAPSA